MPRPTFMEGPPPFLVWAVLGLASWGLLALVLLGLWLWGAL